MIVSVSDTGMNRVCPSTVILGVSAKKGAP
jgi:hypothetical protein